MNAFVNYFESILNNGNANSALQIIPARVIDIILDDSYNIDEFKKYGGWNSIGVIKYKEITSLATEDTPENLNAAFPLFPNSKNYPLKNEIVFILSLPDSTTQFKTSSNSKYYISTINIWNSVHHNALPDITLDKNISKSQQLDYINTSGGIVRRIEDDSSDINLGKTFKEKNNIHSLLPFEGDHIFEGRFGQSIRFGSTVNNSKYKSFWSNGSNDGDPITIIRNGQPQTINDNSWIPILEDINNDQTICVFTSNQIIPIEVASNNQNSFNVVIKSDVILPTSIQDVQLDKSPEAVDNQPLNNEVSGIKAIVPVSSPVSQFVQKVKEDEINFIFPGEEEFLYGAISYTQPQDSFSEDPRNIADNDSPGTLHRNIPEYANENMYYVVPVYNQGDKQWGNLIGLGESYSMKQAGCCQTSFAMILSFLLQNDNITPLSLFNITNHTLVYWDMIIKNLNNTYGKSLSEIQLNNNVNQSAVDSWLSSSGPVLIETKNKIRPTSGFTEFNGAIEARGNQQSAYVGGKQHWMVIIGKNKDGTYDVNDPNGGRIRKQQSSVDLFRDANRLGFINIQTA